MSKTIDTCPNGHPMTPENTYHRPRTDRCECRECGREAARRRDRPCGGLTRRQQFVLEALASGGQAYMPPAAPVAIVEDGNGVRDRTSRLALRRLVDMGLLVESRSGVAGEGKGGITYTFALTPRGRRQALAND